MLPAMLLTIKNVSTPHQRHILRQKLPPIPNHQHKENIVKWQENQRQIDEAVSEWYLYTLAKADDLRKRFNKKPCYFLDIFFQGSAKMVTHCNKTNSFNAFKSLKAMELNEGIFFSLNLTVSLALHFQMQKEALPN